jgi:hypothetical protein
MRARGELIVRETVVHTGPILESKPSGIALSRMRFRLHTRRKEELKLVYWELFSSQSSI